MKVSVYWLIFAAVVAYYFGRNDGVNAATEGAPPSTVAKLANAIVGGRAVADVIDPVNPAANATNPAGTSAWTA